MEKSSKLFFSTIPVIYSPDWDLPKFQERSGLEFVNYGTKNSFPQELLDLYNQSSIHHSILESKSNMIYGEGLEQIGTFSQNTQKFLDKCNPYESWNDIVNKIIKDFIIFGLSYIHVRWDRGRKTIAETYHIDASRIRWGKMDENKNINEYFYCKDWSRRFQNKIDIIPSFNPDERGEPDQIIPILSYTPDIDYYTYPTYIGGLKAITIDIEIDSYHLNNLKQGMFPMTYIGFPYGQLTDEERKHIKENILDEFEGTRGARNIIAFYDPGVDNKPQVQTLEMSNADKMFKELNVSTLQKILISHQITNENLVGISTPGKLSNNSEILQSYELFFNQFIKPQSNIILKSINKIFLWNGMNEIEFIHNKPLNVSFTEATLKEILTKKEMRKMLGVPLVPEEDMMDDEEDKTPTEPDEPEKIIEE